MSAIPRLLCFWFSLPALVIGGLVAIVAVGAGHGTYVPVSLLFPHGTALGMIRLAIHATHSDFYLLFACMVVLVLQFPVYGLVLDWACQRGKLRGVAVGIAVLHVCGIILCGLLASAIAEK